MEVAAMEIKSFTVKSFIYICHIRNISVAHYLHLEMGAKLVEFYSNANMIYYDS